MRSCAAACQSAPAGSACWRPIRGCHAFWADSTFFTVIASYGSELIHPIHEGRSPRQIGKKGKSHWRWIVGMKLCWWINDRGEVVGWAWDTAHIHAPTFLPLVAAHDGGTLVLADVGFHCAEGLPANLKLCPCGRWNEGMLVGTALSLVTRVCGLKKVFHCVLYSFRMRLTYVAALFNTLLGLNRLLEPGADPQTLRLPLPLHFVQGQGFGSGQALRQSSGQACGAGCRRALLTYGYC
jgi:hypothetical protein